MLASPCSPKPGPERMNANEIKDLINNPDIQDHTVYQVLKEFTADRYIETGKLVPISKSEALELQELGELTRAKRPNVLRKIVEEFLAMHGDCSSHKPQS